MKTDTINTLGELKKSGYQPKTIKQELRDNLIRKIKNKENPFPGIQGYEHTVIPDLERAILSGHNILFLGLRGQAKTRLARLMTDLLDDYIPYVKDSEVNDDPLNPLSAFAKETIAIHGDKTPIEWLHKSERYGEKLATPDVSISDLIGDLDPIKAASLKLSYADEKVIHFGLIPRTNRGIFVINELPDLQARIQVSLFNILQEGDIQIRGFKWRFPLDIQFIFTANPEDYTNRGSIVTPLKDRIESQILTHYPKSLEISRAITEQEAEIQPEQQQTITVFETAKDLVEQIAIEARSSEFVDHKSGVSARLTISAYETLTSAVERRMLNSGHKKGIVRLTDFAALLPSITGKIELVYEGEQEGPRHVAENLLAKAIKTHFLKYFPDPSKLKKAKKESPYKPIQQWFDKGKLATFPVDMSDPEYKKQLDNVEGLKELVKNHVPGISGDEIYFFMEFALHGMASCSLLSKFIQEDELRFGDIMTGMFTSENDDDSNDLKNLFQ